MRDVPDFQDLARWEDSLKCKLADLEKEVGPLLAEIDKTKRQLDLVGRLRRIESGDTEGTPADENPKTHGISAEPRASVRDVVAAILEKAGQPLHVSEIRERFLALGQRIPGRGTESNLLSYIVRDPRFARVSKGTYALNSADGGKLHQRARRRGKRRRRASGG